MQRKTHPKDWKYLGRVRVHLKDDAGKLLNPDVPSREFPAVVATPASGSPPLTPVSLPFYFAGQALMVKVAELVPRHPGRTGKAKAAGAAVGGASSSGGVKKSGKKKK